MSVRGFVNLHTHSHYSLLEALPKIEELVAAAKKDEQEALALTDNGNLYAAIEFYKECKSAGIKPIIGVDFFVAPRTRHDKEHRTDDQLSRLVLLAQNEVGYRNLIKLVSLSYLEGFYDRPRIDKELIETCTEGLLAILPAEEGAHVRAFRERGEEALKKVTDWYKRVFKDACYAELAPEEAGSDGATTREAALAAERAGIPLVAARDTYYLKRDDALARELVNKIRTGGALNRDMEDGLKDLSLLNQAEAKKLFKAHKEALENTARIAERCTVELKLGSWVFPAFPKENGKEYNDMLRELAYAGFRTRGIPETEENKARVEYELSVIGTKGYSPYFLVVGDLLRHAREKGILTNTRGSAAGSLVSYLCGITTVNPLYYGLPFERFLNPERPSPPDIDMDLADNKRDELIAYVREKYGSTQVAQIGTFGTMLARAAVRDVARALGHSYGTGDRIAKMIPFGKQGFPVTIQSSLDEVPELKTAYKGDPDAREIIDMARKVEGNARHVGVHAAGVVIAPSPVTDFVPVQLDPKGGKIITQYDMHAVEDAGLLKFDFLGLTNLSVLADSVERVQKRLGISVNLDELPMDDRKTYEILSRGETLGVFQMAGGGMTAHLVELKPTVIHDLNAMVALYRPGPMAFIPKYIERKLNPKLVTYLDPRMEPILKNSYGIITYQDDVLEIAIKLAGYSWLDADKFRKAMGKKIPEEMRSQKEKFIKGCLEHGMKESTVQKLWEQIETFAAYGFNKAHAASYGNLAYKTAYMKANFPVDYMAALLTADAGDVEKIGTIVSECKRMGLTVLPPSVGESFGDFTVVDEKTIRFGLYSIKNFGTGVADSIIEARKSGAFTDLSDFLARIGDKNMNKKSLEALAMSGALDALGERGAMLQNIDALLDYRKEHQGTPKDQVSLFGAVQKAQALTLPDTKPATNDERLAWEKELLGLYVSGHPLDKHRAQLLKSRGIAYAKESLKGVEIVLAGFIESAQPILTKNGERMSFLKLVDFTGSIEVVVFPRVFKEQTALFSPGSCVMLKGKISERNGEPSFVVEKAKAL